MNIFCRKGDLVRLLTPTVSAWQGIGIAAETVYDDGDPDTVVPFYKQDQPLEDQVPSIALIGDVELMRPTGMETEPTDEELHDLWLELYRFHDGPTGGEVATIARAALERWGNRTPAPIPLSERLPTEADCDAEGRCWWWHPESHERNACWCYSRGSGVEPLWLPCWALPVPGVEA